jgi:hypothetical protein
VIFTVKFTEISVSLSLRLFHRRDPPQIKKDIQLLFKRPKKTEQVNA